MPSTPSTIAGRVAYAANMAALVSDPVYGLPDGLIKEVQEVNTELQAAAQAAETPATRTTPAIAYRNQLISRFLKLASRVTSIARANGDLNEKQLEDLDVQPIATKRKEIPAPFEAPVVTAYLERDEVIVKLRRSVQVRGKAENATMASVFFYVEPTAPEAWQPGMTTTRTKIALPIPTSESGDTLWICAFWQHARGASGPTCRPLSINLPKAQVRPVEQQDVAPMRIAA
jgi:hypothetical protein